MKKIIAVSSAIAMMLGAAVNVNAASQNKITVTDGNLRTISFVNDTEDAASNSIKNVLYTLSGLSAKYKNVTQSFEVTSEVEEDGAVDVYLRLSNESASTTAYNDSVELLTFYDIVITDSEDEVVFSTEKNELEVEEVSKNEYAADILLDRFNEDDNADTREYTISVTVPGDCTTSEIKNALNIGWEIVSDPVEDGATPIPVEEVEEVIATEAPVVTEVPVATEAPSVTEAPVEEVEAAIEEAIDESNAGTEKGDDAIVKGERLIGEGEAGKYLAPGTYLASNKVGSTTLTIYDENGELVREVVLDEDNRTKKITLKEGQKLLYEGNKVELVSVEKVEDGGSDKATSSNKPTSSSKSDAKTKTNPKTGDVAPFAGMAAVAVFAVGMLAYPEIEKRRKNNN